MLLLCSVEALNILNYFCYNTQGYEKWFGISTNKRRPAYHISKDSSQIRLNI